jgi:hypothetical protein
MNVYNRPLFRQAGGPAQMMPQDMAQQGMPPQGMAPQGMPPQGMAQQGMPPQGGSGVDPQMEQALTAAEQQSAAGMAEVGASYAESMMSGLDNAEDYKTVIDSIRGNALPMEARYSELASLVGEEDARKTPESVLTLIQPTIMMTEQGAMDSGIGELMRQVTGEIDMEAENGMPTEMGQGVGSLMTAGVGQQPTQNFSLGGPVVRMGTGGNPRLEQLSSEILGNYRNIMGDGEDQKKLTQAQILFDIADAAGRFASGTNAQGQSVAGLSPFAQLGAATSGLGGRIGERVGELDKQDRALKLSALGAAQTEYSAEQAAARAAGTKDKSLGKFFNIIVEGKVVETVPLSSAADYEAYKKTYPTAIFEEVVAEKVSDPQMVGVTVNGTTRYFDLKTERAAFNEAAAVPNAKVLKIGTAETATSSKPELRRVELNGESVGLFDLSNVAPDAPKGKVAFDKFMQENPAAQVFTIGTKPADSAKTANLKNVFLNGEKVGTFDLSILDQKEAYNKFMQENPTAEVFEIGTKPADSAKTANLKNVFLNGEKVGTFDLSILDQKEAYNKFMQENPTAEVFEIGTKPALTAGTSLERLQNRVNDFATVEKFRNNTLNADDLNKFVSDILLWTNPTLDINGNTTRQTMPPALIEALKYRYDKGMDTFNIPEDLFGVDSSGENLTTFKSRIIDPNVSLTAATGLLSGLQRAINYAFEQTLGETPLGAGSTVFKDTSEGTKALLSLRQATSRFLIEGKTLAQEFADMKAELVDPSMFSSDIDALNALKAQRSLLTDQRARVQEVIKNPERYTNPDKSKARELYTYAGQLLSAYDSAITSYQRGLGLEGSGDTSGRPSIDTFFRD